MREENELDKNESEDGMVENIKEELEVGSSVRHFKPREMRRRVTTADKRVERVGCMVRRSEMDEGLSY